MSQCLNYLPEYLEHISKGQNVNNTDRNLLTKHNCINIFQKTFGCKQVF